MNNRYSTCHSVISYRMYNRSLFPYRLRMRVSCSEAGVNVPTFSRLRISLTLVLSPRGVTNTQAPCEGIPLGRYARPHYYCTQLAKMRVSPKWISQLPCLILLNVLARSRWPYEPQPGHRVGPPRVRSTQADTIAEETNKNGPPRVDKRASKREEHSESQSCDETIMGIPQIS